MNEQTTLSKIQKQLKGEIEAGPTAGLYRVPDDLLMNFGTDRMQARRKGFAAGRENQIDFGAELLANK